MHSSYVATHRYHPLSSTQRQPLTQSCSSLLNSSYATTQSRSQPPSRLKQHTVPQVLCLLNSSYALNSLHSHIVSRTRPTSLEGIRLPSLTWSLSKYILNQRSFTSTTRLIVCKLSLTYISSKVVLYPKIFFPYKNPQESTKVRRFANKKTFFPRSHCKKNLFSVRR